MAKLGIYVLIQINEDGIVASCTGYKTLEEAQTAMGKSWDAEIADYLMIGYDDLNIQRSIGLYNAEVTVNGDGYQSWTIKEI